jgi:thiol-disulfide isomerase/thioredoxin
VLSKTIAILLMAGAGLKPLDERGYSALVAGHGNQVLLVSFWATWCEPCRAELRDLAAMEREFPAKDLRVAVISIDEPEQAREARQVWSSTRFRERGYIGTFLDRDRFIDSVDPKWSGALPALFLYDRPGRLVRSFTGDVDVREVRRVVRKVLPR